MKHILLILGLLPFLLKAQIPSYYAYVDFSLSGDNLRLELNALTKEKHKSCIPYTSKKLDTWDVLVKSDLAPKDSNSVVLMYASLDTNGVPYLRSKDSSCHSSSCYGFWNREHVFPKSLSTPKLRTSPPGTGTDLHNLRACDGQMNSLRSNRIFQESQGGAHITPKGNFYPGDEWKGDVARIIMYMYLHYPQQCAASRLGYGALNTSKEVPLVFLNWNAQDPVSEFEMQRNDIIAQYQGNRNPFIDNPCLATRIWGGKIAEEKWGLTAPSQVIIVQKEGDYWSELIEEIQEYISNF